MKLVRRLAQGCTVVSIYLDQETDVYATYIGTVSEREGQSWLDQCLADHHGTEECAMVAATHMLELYSQSEAAAG